MMPCLIIHGGSYHRRPQWAAFFSDCPHEVHEVTSGTRVALAYEIFQHPGALWLAVLLSPLRRGICASVWHGSPRPWHALWLPARLLPRSRTSRLWTDAPLCTCLGALQLELGPRNRSTHEGLRCRWDSEQ